jgi:hypothetical protein
MKTKELAYLFFLGVIVISFMFVMYLITQIKYL